jgi:hypothetical protein
MPDITLATAPNDDLVLALPIVTFAATRPHRKARITHVGPEPSMKVSSTPVPDAGIPIDMFR